MSYNQDEVVVESLVNEKGPSPDSRLLLPIPFLKVSIKYIYICDLRIASTFCLSFETLDLATRCPASHLSSMSSVIKDL